MARGVPLVLRRRMTCDGTRKELLSIEVTCASRQMRSYLRIYFNALPSISQAVFSLSQSTNVVVRSCRMRPSFSHSPGTTHIALSLTGSGSSCSSISTSIIIALVALENFLTSQKRTVPTVVCATFYELRVSTGTCTAGTSTTTSTLVLLLVPE